MTEFDPRVPRDKGERKDKLSSDLTRKLESVPTCIRIHTQHKFKTNEQPEF